MTLIMEFKVMMVRTRTFHLWFEANASAACQETQFCVRATSMDIFSRIDVGYMHISPDVCCLFR